MNSGTGQQEKLRKVNEILAAADDNVLFIKKMISYIDDDYINQIIYSYSLSYGQLKEIFTAISINKIPSTITLKAIRNLLEYKSDTLRERLNKIAADT